MDSCRPRGAWLRLALFDYGKADNSIPLLLRKTGIAGKEEGRISSLCGIPFKEMARPLSKPSLEIRAGLHRKQSCACSVSIAAS